MSKNGGLFSFVQLVGIDLGTQRTRIWTDRGGVVVDEPTCLAVEKNTGKVVAVGSQAAQMSGRSDQTTTVLYPVVAGKIHNLDVCRTLLQILLQPVLRGTLFSPTYMISVPVSNTPAADAAVTQLCYQLGARQVYLLAQPLAAAIGAGVPIADSSGAFMLQMGAGLVEAAVISLGSIALHRATNVAGERASRQIELLLKTEHQIVLAQDTLERVKHLVAGAPGAPAKEIVVTGKSTERGVPEQITIDSEMLDPAVSWLAEKYVSLVRKMLVEAPPELAVDVVDKGVLLSGGWAQLRGWEEFFSSRLGVPVSVIDDGPDLSVVKGLGRVLQNLGDFTQSLGYGR